MIERINDTDAALIRGLQADGRRTNRSLADSVGLAPSTTLQRVRDLEDRGAITGYHAEVDLRHLGRAVEAMVFVRLRPKTDDVVQSFIDHVWAMPEVLAVHLISGAEDALVHVAVPDTDSLRRAVLREISDHHAVVDERTALVFEHRRKHVIDPA
ncbi:MAG: Lrp/AsnC family transcriptional regulator [Actinomycetota bacterium]